MPQQKARGGLSVRRHVERLGRGDVPLELVFRYRADRGDSVVLLRNARETVTLEHVKITKSAGS